MTFDFTKFLHHGDLVYQVIFVVDPENVSDGSTWKLLSALGVFLALCWISEREAKGR